MGLRIFCLLVILILNNNLYADSELSRVEKKFLEASGRQENYPNEKVKVIETNDAYELGRLAALRFLEWVSANPNGVVSLPLGRTPEHFIKQLTYYKKSWNSDAVQAELSLYNISKDKFPDTSNLKFVQSCEVYSISPENSKNFVNFVKKYYLPLFNLKPENILLMDFGKRGILGAKGHDVVFQNNKVDLDLLNRKPNGQIEKWQKQALNEAISYCDEIEEKIKSWGGIGFVMLGVGPDGYINFNMPGSTKDSKTRLTKLNYVAMAHSANDLGGIEHAKDSVAITLGLKTITYNPDVQYIVLANGGIKMDIVKKIVEEKSSNNTPASVLIKLKNSKIFATKAAARGLLDRQVEDVWKESFTGFSNRTIDKILIDIALIKNKSLDEISYTDLQEFRLGQVLLARGDKKSSEYISDCKKRLVNKIESSLHSLDDDSGPYTHMHIGAHHDDVLLSYYPYVKHLLANHKNYFVHVTSGFNSVTDSFIAKKIQKANDYWLNKNIKDILYKPYVKILEQYRDAYIEYNDIEQKRLETVIILKNLAKIYNVNNLKALKNKLRWLKDEYLASKYPGKSDSPDIQKLKGMIRESEIDRVWRLNKVQLRNIIHLRTPFYSSNSMTRLPKIKQDVKPVLYLYQNIKPKFIFVVDDPENFGSGTNYKVSQMAAQALRMYPEANMTQIYGYRTVWSKYDVHEANVMLPISELELSNLRYVYLKGLSTQRKNSFPPYFYSGNFADLNQKLQEKKLNELKVLLGDDYFKKHPDPRIRAAKGMIFFRKMTNDEFLNRVEDLRTHRELEKVFAAS